MSNETVKAVVEAYLKQKDPGYALLIDAPWGAGKTHFIRQFIDEEHRDPLYVTLYDVHSVETFDWALVRAAKPWTESKTGQWATRAKEFASGIKVLGFGVDLNKMNLTEFVLTNLPNTLIFDDIERCGLSHKQLSGLINRFVEHQKKRVILLANSEKHADKDSFDKGREKLIGQTVTLKADLDAALIGVWAKVPDGQGKTVLQTHQHLIKETFDEAGHQNLRLILRAVRDCTVMLDALTKEMLGFEEAVDRLIRTHLALHMAYHGGELGKEELETPNPGWGHVIAKHTGAEPPPKSKHELRFEALTKKHPAAELDTYQNSVFPKALRKQLLVGGYAKPNFIRARLMKTNHFTPSAQRPDWVRLWSWDEESVDDLKELLKRIEGSIQSHKLVEPGEILQVYAALNWYGKYSESITHKENTRRFYDHINALIEKDLIRKRSPHGRDRNQYGFSWEAGRISFDGYTFDPDHRAKLLAKKLRGVMDAAYERELPRMGGELVYDLQHDPGKFQGFFEYQTSGLNFSEAPILQACDVQAFATALLDWHEKDKGIAQHIAKTVGKRSAGIRQELALEHPWIDKLKTELITQAAAKHPLLAAQVRLFIARHMTPD
ncbi:P-loop NTPase fold protein [uncultured Pelagimonas sp.]|uniref:P-loop NTPase fold protein n=1 Tax=uncultured Pelagimonas sp. TaxID=1618102 RepID=UPI00262B55DE|nr:P-loop NTPase fold protein [uncultured Pelagimonas sp.]